MHANHYYIYKPCIPKLFQKAHNPFTQQRGSEFSRGPFWDSRGPPSLLGIHTVPEIPAVPLSGKVNWREILKKKTAQYINFIKGASRAISGP